MSVKYNETKIFILDSFSRKYTNLYKYKMEDTIASKINVTPKGVRLSEKLQSTAALCIEILPQ